MSRKRELIEQMLEAQRKFIAHEHQSDFQVADYYVPPESHPLHGYRDSYRDMAMEVVELAHEEKGSTR